MSDFSNLLTWWHNIVIYRVHALRTVEWNLKEKNSHYALSKFRLCVEPYSCPDVLGPQMEYSWEQNNQRIISTKEVHIFLKRKTGYGLAMLL